MSNAAEAENAKVKSEPRRTTWMPPDIVPFAVKTCIVAVVISACTIFVVDWIVSDLQDFSLQMMATVRDQINSTPIGGAKVWTKIERELDRAADPTTDLPPQKKQKLINDVRVIIARWRPFLDAAQDELQKPRQN
jgi:hypothetical protein